MEILPISAMRDTNMISEICTQQKGPMFIKKNGTGHPDYKHISAL